ncbi:hypothetical protein CRE_17976 [Caenorhabditis remanei]|uniref:F-box associated domain-containing protein n=1 Tax=Caenorhabditis remanei TaxID=31234 RepID=E3MDU6_CAERE|nr:hypothetical protein CRE_17976 [Caenorhabditis remanei]
MPDGLSYPALRCVLENLDAMKRLHITARSPALKRIDKGIPLNIRSIDIEEKYVRRVDLLGMNGYKPLAFRIDGDVSIVLYKQELVFNKSGSQVCRREVPLGSAEKYLNYYLGGGRSKVSVDKFSIGSSRITPPAGVQLTINELDNRRSDFRKNLPNINPDSFPLKMFAAEFTDAIDFDHPIVHSSKNLVLSMNFYEFTDQALLSLARQFPTKDIQFDCNLWQHDLILNFIKTWIENRKTIGAKSSFLFSSYRCLPSTFNKLLQEFNNLQEVNERSILSFTIPINSQSKIHVYGVDEPKRLVVEVVPTTDSV